MQLDISHRNYEPTKRVRSEIEERAEKFTKFVPDLIRVRFTLTGERIQNICEIHLHASGKDFHSSASTEDMLASLDKAASSMEKQLRRNKTKRSDHKVRFEQRGITSAAALEASLEVKEDAGDAVTGDEES